MPESLTLRNILDDAAIFSFEHQLHLQEVLGQHSWNVDLNKPLFQFTGSNPIVCTNFHLLGTAAPGPRSWLWAWANPSGFPEPLTALSKTLRDFGHQYGIAEFTSAEVPFDKLPTPVGEPPVVAGLLAEAAKTVTGRWTSYVGDAGGGTWVAFLVEHPAFQLPPPEPARVMRVIQQAIAEIPLSDHRRALYGYAVRRQLEATFTDQGKLVITGPGFEAAVDFDQYSRVAAINASLSSPHDA
ncbi:DUF6882 domain-containing protein [Thermostaphylospora chromogena]|uniref:Uncharacterized protein n=1 Tax=Thermostaphylospora chromogena TaxID=35622 RepID=A0A1H1FC21_9ACTN|nr:DUF6882 domain-containing protein [Thermostaphylospora chromogena]SDQ98460.1 hypothetical protein SAMN04489764_2906 [Thermostaphylospora chromogena]